MERLIAAFSQLSPRQRWILGGLVAGVLILVGVVVATAGDDPAEVDAAPETTTSTTTTTSLPETTTTSTSTTTSSTTTTSTTTTTTTTLPPESILTLRPDGLGDTLFGESADTAIATLVEVLGSPSDDTGWVPTGETYATCIGSEVRFVTWGSLRAFFTNGPSDWAPADTRHFASYDHTPAIGAPVLALATAEGVGIGSPVGDVRAIYGDDAIIEGDPLFGNVFQVRTSGAGFLWGSLSGLSASDTVLSVSGGVSCGE